MARTTGVSTLIACALTLSPALFAGQKKRAVTVADAIGMTKLGNPSAEPGQFSPDGQKFVLVLKKGNLEKNTNEYSLLLWRTDQIFRNPKPEVLAVLSSSSNRPAIRDVRWLADSQTLFFLGEHPGELQQLYSLDVSTRVLKKLTNAQSSVVSYTMAARGDNILYAAGPSETDIFDRKTEREGLLVSLESLYDIIAGHKLASSAVARGEVEFFLQRPGKPPSSVCSRVLSPVRFHPPVMSPDGDYVVIQAVVDSIPASWSDYLDPNIRWWTKHEHTPLPTGQRTSLLQTILLNTSSGEFRPLLDAPTSTSSHTEVAWSPDSKSVIITNTYLPIANADKKDHDTRLRTVFSAAEVRIADREIRPVSQEDLNSPVWLDGHRLSFRAGKSKTERTAAKMTFEERDGMWTKVDKEPLEQSQLRITQDEDLNKPPRMIAVDPKTGRRAVLLDLNPQFADLLFANERAIEWKGSDGHPVKGGLYYPIGYEPGRKYPLVIQTHAFARDRFWIDGPFTTAFAAQPLASHGIMVLQMEEDYGNSDTGREVDREVASLEGAIDHLNEQELIDRERVGVIGFSRTCLHVKFALTHSKYHFAAASVSDGVDNGYFQYVLGSGIMAFDESLEGSNGGLPFGEGLESWMRRSPGFNVDKVTTPLLIFAPSPLSALFEWEWFAALHRLGKPVEMVVLAEGEHELQKPWDRRVSLQHNVDWFCYWLKGVVDDNPTKAPQYARWDQLRKLQEQNDENSNR